MGEQDPHFNWPKHKTNKKFCPDCHRDLFKNDHYRHIMLDCDTEVGLVGVEKKWDFTRFADGVQEWKASKYMIYF